MKQLVSFAAFAAGNLIIGFNPLTGQDVNQIKFNLSPNPAVINCLTDGSGLPPTATVLVTRGALNDQLVINTQHIRPNTGFDMFTVQRSNLLSDGTVDPNFTNFGLAWYQ